MGCVCLESCVDGYGDGGWACRDDPISRRNAKQDIVYLSDAHQLELARQALDIKLANYRYRNEPPSARRRLGFIIEDQPDPSPAVTDDRAHVDEYGYTSLLLVLVQQQQRELDALRERVEQLESVKACR